MSTVPSQPGPNRLLIIVIAISGVLLLAVVALVFLLVGQNLAENNAVSSTTTPSAATSETTAPSPTDDDAVQAPTVDTSTRFTSFDAPTTVMCDAGDEDNQPPKPEIQVSWASANAVEAWYTPSNEDAKDDNYMQIPLSGNQGDLTDEHLFPCFHENEVTYTITLVGANGEHVSEQWTVTNVGDQ